MFERRMMDMGMVRKIFDVAVIIPDASPVLTLARIGGLDLLGAFQAPIRIVDQVQRDHQASE